jgi:hypothetical protein
MSDYVRMTIAVPKEAYNRLRESAQRDMRQPRQQAHWLLYQALGLASEEVQPQQNANRAGYVLPDISAAAN